MITEHKPLKLAADKIYKKALRFISEAPNSKEEVLRTQNMLAIFNQMSNDIASTGKCPRGKVEDPKTGLCVPASIAQEKNKQ